MPSDSAKKTRVVVDRGLVEQAQAKAVRDGLGEKSPSLLVDMTLRAWLRSGPLALDAPGEESPGLAERVATLEAKLSGLAAEASERFRALEEGKPLRELPAATGRRQVVSPGLPAPEAGPSPRREGASRKPDTTSRPPGGSADVSTPAGLAAAMKARGYSAKSLAEALGMGDRGSQVGRWLKGKAPVPPERLPALADLLGSRP